MGTLISVIVPVYNSEVFVSKCIDSILRQTYPDIEIILVNDGSSDKSREICERYESYYSNIVLINQANQGAGKARNRGLDVAKGAYIGFVDSDDVIEPDMYEKMMSVAEKDHCDVVQCGYEKVTYSGEIIERSHFREEILTGARKCVEALCIQENVNYYTPCKLIKKEVIGSIRFDNYHSSEDAVFLLNVFLNCNKLSILNTPWYKYIQSDGSICRSEFTLKKLDILRAGKKMIEMMDNTYPEFSFYYLKYTIHYSINCYINLLKCNLDDKTAFSDPILKNYRKYYKRFRQDDLFPSVSLREKLLFKTFFHSPSLVRVAMEIKNKLHIK